MKPTLGRYDLVLGIVAVALLSGGIVTAATAVPLRTSATGATIVAGGALYDAMVRNPPTGEE